MKVQSWWTLLVTVFVGGAMFLWALKDAFSGDWFSIIWVFWAVYLIRKGLSVSFSEKEFEKDRKNAEKGKRVYREKFGVFGPVMPYLHIVILLIDLLLITVLPLTPIIRCLGLALFFVAAAYAVCMAVWFRRKMRE